MLCHKLSPEILEYQKLARDFAERNLREAGGEHKESQHYPEELVAAAWEAGLLNMALPETCGGLGLGCLETTVIAEELAWGEAGLAGLLAASEAAQRYVLEGGTEDQKNALLSPLMDSPQLCGYAMEGESGLSGGKVFYRKDGDEYFLSGKHGAVMNGGVPGAAWYIFKAYEDRRESNDATGSSGGLYFVVPAGEDGLEFAPPLEMLGRKAQFIAPARLEEVMVDKANVLGTPGQCEKIFAASLVKNFPLVAASMVGIARAALEHALKYSKERHTFGVPISNFQGISFMLADMAKDIEAARLLVYQAAQLADQGLGQLCIAEAVCAKAFAQDMVMRVTTDAVQVYGGYGFSKEYPVEKLMRDAKVSQLLDGTSELLKVNLGRQLVTAL